MKELKCPQCGNVFKVDEADYASIAEQVRTSEFEAEICKRLDELKVQQAAQAKVKEAESREAFNAQMQKKQDELQKKEQELAILKDKLAGIEDKKKLEITQAVSDKDLEIVRLKNAIELQKSEQDKAVMAAREKMQEDITKKERELAELVPDHIFRDVYRNMLSAVVNSNGMTDKFRENSGCTRPGLENLLLASSVHFFNALQQHGLNERALLNRSAH